MANLRRWSTTATGNATVAGGVNTINFAEGQTPGSVNNSAREMMAQIRGIYTPSDWGWVENSATASVASQTTFKLAGNQTSDWVAPRRWRLKSGSTTRYGTVVSSSYTVETTITVTVDSGSLSASHSLAALSAVMPEALRVIQVTDNTNAALRITQLGTGDALVVEDSATPDSTPFKVNASGDVFGVSFTSTGGTIMTADGNNTATPGTGTVIAPAASGTNVTGGTLQLASGVGTGTGGSGPIIFYTAPADGSGSAANTLAERMRIFSNGNVLITGSGGLGYGTGSGGTVTQLTSKSTAVTLNKTNGQITMNNAALAASASVVFVVNNSTFVLGDTVVLSTAFGNYRIDNASSTAAGVFSIRVTNISGGSLSEAVPIYFAIIKAVTS